MVLNITASFNCFYYRIIIVRNLEDKGEHIIEENKNLSKLYNLDSTLAAVLGYILTVCIALERPHCDLLYMLLLGHSLCILSYPPFYT